VGGLIGALHGVQAIPPEMKTPVLTCHTKSGRPRPDYLHPKHVEKLTEDLLTYGPKAIVN
jgi:hypothetical protein